MGLKYRIKQHLKENSTQYLIILAIFVFGFIFGFINVKGLDDQVKSHLTGMLDNYLRAGIEGDLYGRNIFINAFIKQVETILSIWLLGLTVIGLPLILVVVFLRAFSVGFTVGFLFQEKAGAGVLLSMISILPQNLVYIPCLLFAAIIAMNFSVDIVRNRGSGNSLGLALLSYSIVMLVIILLFALGAFIEAYLSPWMLSWFI
jgi:stage II sporulation protein M